MIRRTRRVLAARAELFAAAAARPGASAADILVSEMLPLLAACRFLERRAERILAPTRPPGRPLWLFGTHLRVRRVPLGCVLVIGPANYPLLLPGVQILQALAAGNAVVVKPAPGCAAPMHLLRAVLVEAGLPESKLTVQPDGGHAAIGDDLDHVVLTGSAATGRAVLAAAAPLLLATTMELSGRDAMIVLEGADVAFAVQAAVFGLGFNAGRTCIAPRRILVAASLAARFVPALEHALAQADLLPVAPGMRDRVEAIIGEKVSEAGMRPLVVPAAGSEAWVHEDLFAPLAALIVVKDEAAAVALANAGPYALGASVFGPAAAARHVAGLLRAGCVVVNDMIVPTAHPALPFGGTGASGFGVTRGAEGLLAMTRPQALVERRLAASRHLTRLSPDAAAMVAALLRLTYGPPGPAAVLRVIRAVAAAMQAAAARRRSAPGRSCSGRGSGRDSLGK